MKYQLSRANSFKRSFKKTKLTDDEETNYIEVIYNLLIQAMQNLNTTKK
jgi:mRNA-degrading endonuclease YafQ of YafQ-DinJ toxin-antitoxin module